MSAFSVCLWMDRCGEILKADCLHNGYFQKYSGAGSHADRGLGGTPRYRPRPKGPAIQAERCLHWTSHASGDTRRLIWDTPIVRFIDHFCWIVGYPPSAASLGYNGVLCQWRFIVSCRGNKLQHCYDSLFWWAHLTLLGTLQFQCTHLRKCRIPQKNAEDVAIRWRAVSENFQ